MTIPTRTATTASSFAALFPAILCSGLSARGDEPAAATSVLPPSPPAAARQELDELRAIWVTRWDFRTAEDVRRVVERSAAYGFHRVFLQVRGRADAFYRSRLEPWGEELGGRDPGFDPLEIATETAHRLGVELHAWVNVLRAWKGSRPPRDPDHVLHRRPEWFLVDRLGKRHLTTAGDYTILNPCLPEVRDYIVRVVEDIAARYAIDGMHFDYVRFIGRDPKRGRDFSYDPATLSLFRKYAGATPDEDPEAWHRWRRLAVNTLLYRAAEATRAARAGCVISVAAIKDYVRAREGLFQDVVTWQEQAWVDEVFPMTYADTIGDFRRAAGEALRLSPAPERVFPGIGVHLFESPAELIQQVEAARSLGARGYALFAYASFFPSRSHESRRDPVSRRLRAGLRAALETLQQQPEG